MTLAAATLSLHLPPTSFLKLRTSIIKPWVVSRQDEDEVTILGFGWVEWTVRDVFGRTAVVRTQAYLIPEGRIRLFSSQSYFQENKAGSLFQRQHTAKLWFSIINPRAISR